MSSCRLKISLDVDQTIADFINPYYARFGEPKNDYEITRNVFRKLKYDREFWTTLPVLETINFIPEIYCTKRINPKSYSKEWLRRNNFPIRPIYQMYYQKGNKADMIRGVCDVLIDDSIFNVEQCLNSGFPAILIDRPHNRHSQLVRIYNLDMKEIEHAYELVLDGIKRH